MDSEKHKTRNYFVEIWFRIEKDEDGYPQSKDWEQLLARPTETLDEFEVESVPFYLKNVSRGDIVKAKIVDGAGGQIFQFGRVVKRGAHNTYRLLIREKQAGDPDLTVKELTSKGLAVEEQHGNFLAVDVPPSVAQSEIDDYLVAESNSGRWEMQDGYLHTVKTSVPGEDAE
jgi:uncharacterized protein DUF4265